MSTAITTQPTAEELNERVHSAVNSLTALADSLEDAELGVQVLNLAALTNQGTKGFDDDDERVSIPRLYLCQNITASDMKPEDCKAGQFFSSMSENLGNEFPFIPIKGHAIRRKWGEEKIECGSLDGKTGFKYGSCAECPWGQFEKGVKPECSPGYSYYVVTEDLKRLYRLEFLKSSAAAGKNIKRLALPPALWSRSFTLSSDHVKETNRNYFKMKVATTGRRISAEHMEICDKLHDFFDAVHRMAIVSQAAYASRLAASDASEGSINTAGEAVIITDDDPDVVDFSTSM